MSRANVKHPCAGMTKAQRAAFETVATQGGGPIAAHRKSIEALLARGVIERARDQVVGRDRFGAISIPYYAVPIHVHIQWCEWCAQQGEADIAAGRVHDHEDVKRELL